MLDLSIMGQAALRFLGHPLDLLVIGDVTLEFAGLASKVDIVLEVGPDSKLILKMFRVRPLLLVIFRIH